MRRGMHQIYWSEKWKTYQSWCIHVYLCSLQVPLCRILADFRFRDHFIGLIVWTGRLEVDSRHDRLRLRPIFGSKITSCRSTASWDDCHSVRWFCCIGGCARVETSFIRSAMARSKVSPLGRYLKKSHGDGMFSVISDQIKSITVAEHAFEGQIFFLNTLVFRHLCIW